MITVVVALVAVATVGAEATITTKIAQHGRRAVLVSVTGASAEKGYSAVGTTQGLSGLRPGMKVTTWLWVPGARRCQVLRDGLGLQARVGAGEPRDRDRAARHRPAPRHVSGD